MPLAHPKNPKGLQNIRCMIKAKGLITKNLYMRDEKNNIR